MSLFGTAVVLQSLAASLGWHPANTVSGPFFVPPVDMGVLVDIQGTTGVGSSSKRWHN